MVISFFMSSTHPEIASFLDYLKFQKRYSQHTISSYSFDIESFRSFLEINFNEHVVTAKGPMVRTWLASLKECGISSRSINRKISSLKSMYKFLMKKGAVKESPMASIISPRSGKRLPQYVDEKSSELLFTHVEFPEGYTGMMEKLVLELLYHTGMRQGELLGLKDESFDFAGRTVKVFGKGSKHRVLPVSENLANSVKAFISERNRLWPSAGTLFLSPTGKKAYPRLIYSIVNKYLSLVTTIEKKSPHVLRHTFATQLMGNGADLNAVKELLGHSSLAATQVYTHNNIQKLKDIYKKAHPRAEE